MRHLAAVAAVAGVLGSPGYAAAVTGCVALGDLGAPAVFARYPAVTPRVRWRAPDVRDGEARLFRTRLREGSVGAPNFAGRYSVVEIGCGAGAVCPAFVDRATGRVRFEPAFRVVAELGGRFADAGIDYERLTYRSGSRLLLVVGAPNEVARQAGARLYDWRGGRAHLVRFVPVAALCGAEPQ